MKMERWNENKALENATKRLLSNHAFIWRGKSGQKGAAYTRVFTVVQFVINHKATFSNTKIERKLEIKFYHCRRKKKDTSTLHTSGSFRDLTFIFTNNLLNRLGKKYGRILGLRTRIYPLSPLLVKFNPLTPMSDQDRISPYSINTISTR